MEKQQLRDVLTQLDAELRQTESVDDETREVLRRLRQDIQALLNRPEDEPAEVSARHYNSLGVRLRAALVRFEATHPYLTASMERVIDALVQMGV